MEGTVKKLQYDIQALASLDIDKYVRKAAGKCEENVKIKIVVPLLGLLGYNPQQDMDFEHHVRNKRADIALIFDNNPKLLVEVKDLDEILDNHVNQGLNYAYTKGVEWVILTNGLEIRVYKSFIPYIPPEDRLIFAAILSNLPQSFNALFELVGKEHLQEGKRLNEKAESIRENITTKILIEDLAECRKRLANDLFVQFKARYETDSEFKEIIDTWATDVKMNISDPGLIEKLCREGAYTLINRVLFLRICEDKGHIKAKLSKNAIAKWREMVEDPSKMLGMAFEEIGDSFEGLYKSPLFDSINFEDVEWNVDTIYFVLGKLGEHDFSKISKDILGKAYEQHISRKERKELGQFYTPDFVIDYILDQVGIAPDKTILDPACGSGGFLMKAYDRLRKQHLEQHWAEDKIHNEILKKNLFGIDINPFATQLTVMNLLLKDLDHPTGEINVVEGNSLDKTYDGFEMDILETDSPLGTITGVNKQVSLVKLLRERPFDIVVSNPPYVTLWGIDKTTKNYLQKNYKCATGRFNTFTIFLERVIDLISDGGTIGFVVPEGLLSEIEYRFIREYVLQTCKILNIAFLPKDTFTASVDTIAIILQKESNYTKRKENKVGVTVHSNNHTIASTPTYYLNQDLFLANEYKMFLVFLTPEIQGIYEQIHEQTTSLKTLVEIQQGIIYSGLPKQDVFSNKKQNDEYVKILDGRDIGRYQNNYHLKAENRYLWYGSHLHRPREERLFLAEEKLLLQRRSPNMVATIDDEQFYALNTLYILLPLENKEQVNLKYILALLNSSLMNWVYKKTWLGWQVTIPALDILPIKTVDEGIQKKLGAQVDRLLNLYKQLNDPAFADEKEAIQREIDTTDTQIDEKVFALYGLTEKEKQIIEASLVRKS